MEGAWDTAGMVHGGGQVAGYSGASSGPGSVGDAGMGVVRFRCGDWLQGIALFVCDMGDVGGGDAVGDWFVVGGGDVDQDFVMVDADVADDGGGIWVIFFVGVGVGDDGEGEGAVCPGGEIEGLPVRDGERVGEVPCVMAVSGRRWVRFSDGFSDECFGLVEHGGVSVCEESFGGGCGVDDAPVQQSCVSGHCCGELGSFPLPD